MIFCILSLNSHVLETIIGHFRTLRSGSLERVEVEIKTYHPSYLGHAPEVRFHSIKREAAWSVKDQTGQPHIIILNRAFSFFIYHVQITRDKFKHLK